MYFKINNKKIKTLIFLLLTLFHFSCSNDHDELEKSKPIINSKVQIALQLPSDKTSDLRTTATDNETLITNLSLFIFESETGNKEFSTRIDIPYTEVSADIDMSRWVTDQVIMILNSEILANIDKPRDIHIVSNIPESKLASVTNESSLEAVITDAISQEIASPDSDKPLVMHGSKKGHNFMVDVRASISLTRNVSKVMTTITTNDFMSGGIKYLLAPANQNLSIRMANVADRSFIVPALLSPSSVNYISYDFKTVTPFERVGGRTTSAFNSYINENLQTSYDEENNATFVVIQVPYLVEGDNEIKTNNYYKIFVNEKNGYKVNRNTIYKIGLTLLTLGGETDASAKLVTGELDVLPWDENTIVSDISQTFLTVKETAFTMATSKDFYYATNAESVDCSLEPGANWLRASFDANNNIKLTASGEDYTTPRSTTLKIKVKNLTKLITVNQEPIQTTGSINLNPKIIYLSDVSTTKDVVLTVNPISSAWAKTDEGNTSIASCNITTATGNQTLRFTRGSTLGNTIYKFLNKSTLEYDEIKVCNLNLTIPADINVGGDGADFIESGIIAEGGDANWVVKSTSDWITSASNVGGELHFTTVTEPNELDRIGSIIIAHINDPNYTKEILVKQSAKYLVLPEFDYMVVRYIAGSKPNNLPAGDNEWDLDTYTEISGTGVSGLDNQPAGALRYTTLIYKQIEILKWGGDNRKSGYETTFVNMQGLLKTSIYDELSSNFNINLYATWWGLDNAKPWDHPIQIEITLYKGGVMEQVNEYDFHNVGGNQVGEKILINDVDITTRTNNNKYPLYNQGSFTYIGSVKYDKLRNKTVFERASS